MQTQASSWLRVVSILQEFILGPVLLNVINSMGVGTKSPLRSFVDDIHLEGLGDMLEGRTAIQKDHDKLEKRIDESHKLQKGQMQTPASGME